MSPKQADPTVRTALIDAAAHLLAEGPQALTTRRLAGAVGTSTMAVYTYFRGMDELRLAVRKEGFDRLSSFLGAVTPTDDPVADVAAMGGAYLFNAVSNPHLYRFMFMETPGEQDEVGEATFESLVAGVERGIQMGRFARADAYSLATQMWAMSHGIVTLHLAGLMTLDEAIDCATEMGLNLFYAFGDDRALAERSVEAARTRFAAEAALFSAAASTNFSTQVPVEGVPVEN